MNDLETCLPRRNPVFYGGDHIIIPYRKRVKAPSFLTGFTQIALTRLGLTHLLSMELNLSD